jgi:PAS domain S-box-containing protein
MRNNFHVFAHLPPDRSSADTSASGPSNVTDTYAYDHLDSGAWSRRPDGPEDADQRWHRLQSLVNQLPGAVYRCTYDTSWSSLFMGAGFKDICGIDPQQLDPAGRSFRDVIFDEDIPRIKAAVAEAVENETYYSIEYRVHTDDDSMKWLEDNGRPFFDGDSVKWLDGILLDITKRKRASESLRRLTETLEETVEVRTRQVRALAAELSMVEQHERSQIARTLHDEIQQFLYGVQVQTTMLLNDIRSRSDIDEDKLSVNPEQVDTLLQKAIQTTRGLTVDLAPPVLDDDGLGESLQWLRSHLKQTRDFTVKLTSDSIEFDIPEEIRLVLFQAVRELLGNAATHAGVNTAQVELTETSDHIVLQVVDRGCGFNVDAEMNREHAGYGLRTASERLRLLGALFQIESEPGEGTTCTIRFPKDKMDGIPTITTEKDVGDTPTSRSR